MPPLPIITSNYPPMTGSAGEPVEVAPQGAVRYTLTQTDQDTYYDAVTMTTRQQPDPTCQIAPYRINALQQYQFLPRGITAQGVVTWDVRGIAVARAGIYFDIWTLFNIRQNFDPGFDPPLRVAQTVAVKAPQAGPTEALLQPQPPGIEANRSVEGTVTGAGADSDAASLRRSLEAMDAHRILADASAHALFHLLLEDHAIGAAIRNDIINAMDADQDRQLQELGIFELPLAALKAMPGDLYERVRRYAVGEQDRIRRGGASFPALDLTNEAEVRVILRAVGNSVPSIGGISEDGRYLQF